MGMAYPQRRPESGKPVREERPLRDVAQRNYVHFDIEPENGMSLGFRDPYSTMVLKNCAANLIIVFVGSWEFEGHHRAFPIVKVRTAIHRNQLIRVTRGLLT